MIYIIHVSIYVGGELGRPSNVIAVLLNRHDSIFMDRHPLLE